MQIVPRISPAKVVALVLQTLLVLVERAGQVVRKADLLQAVWPDSFVEETGLSRNISLLRQALAGDAPRCIATVARVGYRFEAPVERVDAPVAPPPAGDGLLTARGERSAESIDTRRLTRLLVLPFRLLRDDPETGFLAFSVPDAVVNALSGLHALVVRSSAAASRFGSDPLDLKQIATEAGVDAVLTGTLLRSRHQIRVSAQLLSVPSGTVLWSQSFQAALREIFESLRTRPVAPVVHLQISLSYWNQHDRRPRRSDRVRARRGRRAARRVRHHAHRVQRRSGPPRPSVSPSPSRTGQPRPCARPSRGRASMGLPARRPAVQPVPRADGTGPGGSRTAASCLTDRSARAQPNRVAEKLAREASAGGACGSDRAVL